MKRALSALVAVPAALLVGAGAALAAEPGGKPGGHVLPNPLAEKQDALRQTGLGMLLNGDLPKGTKVGKVAKGQYVKLAQEGEGRTCAILAEFGNQVYPGRGSFNGPLTGRWRRRTARWTTRPSSSTATSRSTTTTSTSTGTRRRSRSRTGTRSSRAAGSRSPAT